MLQLSCVFPRLDPCESALPVAHQPPFWPAAQAGSRRLHSAESSLRNTQQEHGPKRTKRTISGNFAWLETPFVGMQLCPNVISLGESHLNLPCAR